MFTRVISCCSTDDEALALETLFTYKTLVEDWPFICTFLDHANKFLQSTILFKVCKISWIEKTTGILVIIHDNRREIITYCVSLMNITIKSGPKNGKAS